MTSAQGRREGRVSCVSQPAPLAAALRQAQALRAAGDLTTARALLADEVDAARPLLGEDHPDLLGAQHALATLHREAGDPAAARRVLEEALAAGELQLGEADPLLLALAFDLGTVAEELGNRHEARRNFTRVATHGPAAFGEDHHLVRTAAAYLSSAGGELPPLPPLQPTAAPPPPSPTPGARPGPSPAGSGPWSPHPAPTPPPGTRPAGPAFPPATGGRPAGPAFPHTGGPPTTWPPPAGWPGNATAAPDPRMPSPPEATASGGAAAPPVAGAAAPSRAGHEVAPGVVASPRTGADAARAAIDAPTQALPTQGGRRAGATLADAGPPDHAGRPGQDAPTAASDPGRDRSAAPHRGGAGWATPPAGDRGAPAAWGREVEPARERLPKAFGHRPESAASPATAVEVAPVSLHGPMAAAAARERARGRGATVAAFVAAGAAVVAALLVLVVVLRPEAEPPRVGAVPETSTGAPVPGGPALGGEPPTDLAVREDGDALLLTWSDPTAGTVPFIVAAGRAGTQLRAMATVEPGSTRYLANGLSGRYDYCFTVVAVYSSDQYAASGQVCTTRTSPTPR
jgi:hypothetical protein